MSKPMKLSVAAGMLLMLVLLALCPPKSSADVAAWVQAFGSIAAVGAAIWITQANERDYRHRAWKMSTIFTAQLLGYCAELRDTSKRGDTGQIRRAADRLVELIAWGRDIEVHMLPEQQIQAFFEIRATAAATLGRAREINSLLYDYEKAGVFFEDQRALVHDLSIKGFWIPPEGQAPVS